MVLITGQEFVHGKLAIDRIGIQQEVIAQSDGISDESLSMGLRLKTSNPLNSGEMSRIIALYPQQKQASGVCFMGEIDDTGRSNVPGHFIILDEANLKEIDYTLALLLSGDIIPKPKQYERITSLEPYQATIGLERIKLGATRSRFVEDVINNHFKTAAFFYECVAHIYNSTKPIAFVDADYKSIPDIYLALSLAIPPLGRRLLSFTTYSKSGWRLPRLEDGVINIRYNAGDSDADREQSVVISLRSLRVMNAERPSIKLVDVLYQQYEQGGAEKALDMIDGVAVLPGVKNLQQLSVSWVQFGKTSDDYAAEIIHPSEPTISRLEDQTLRLHKDAPENSLSYLSDLPRPVKEKVEVQNVMSTEQPPITESPLPSRNPVARSQPVEKNYAPISSAPFIPATPVIKPKTAAEEKSIEATNVLREMNKASTTGHYFNLPTDIDILVYANPSELSAVIINLSRETNCMVWVQDHINKLFVQVIEHNLQGILNLRNYESLADLFINNIKREGKDESRGASYENQMAEVLLNLSKTEHPERALHLFYKYLQAIYPPENVQTIFNEYAAKEGLVKLPLVPFQGKSWSDANKAELTSQLLWEVAQG